RPLVHHIVHYAERRGAELGIRVGFSVTTNATLWTPEDVALMRGRPFAVTVSIDGGRGVQDQQRPRSLLRRRGSFDAVAARVAPLLRDPGGARISARATVLAPFSDRPARFRALVELGFEDIGFAPLRTSPSGDGALAAGDWPIYLEELKAVAAIEVDRARQ